MSLRERFNKKKKIQRSERQASEGVKMKSRYFLYGGHVPEQELFYLKKKASVKNLNLRKYI